MTKWVIILLMLSTEIAFARLYCAQDIKDCHEADYACQMANQVLKNIFDPQEKWSEFFNVDARVTNSVTFLANGRYCRHLGYKGKEMATISLNLITDTNSHKKYEVTYSACGKDNFLTEHWEIKGEGLKPLKKVDIFLHKKRKINLANNETHKDFYLTSNINRFEVPQKYFSPAILNADIIFRSTYNKYKSINKDGKLTEKTQSFVWLFDKKLFSQAVDLGNKESYKFYFNSPSYSFASRSFKARDICFESEVIFSNDDKGRELIFSSSVSDEFGMSYEVFKKDCARKETLNYLKGAESLFKLFFERSIPKFTSAVALDRNKKLKKEIEELISYARAGDQEVTLQKLRQLQTDIKNERILDAR